MSLSFLKNLKRTTTGPTLPKPSLPQKPVGIGNKRPMASLDANENAPIPKRACKSAQHQSKPVQSPPKSTAEPVAKINRENFFSGISLKPNGLFDLPDLNEHFDKQFDEVSAQNTFR